MGNPSQQGIADLIETAYGKKLNLWSLQLESYDEYTLNHAFWEIFGNRMTGFAFLEVENPRQKIREHLVRELPLVLSAVSHLDDRAKAMFLRDASDYCSFAMDDLGSTDPLYQKLYQLYGDYPQAWAEFIDECYKARKSGRGVDAIWLLDCVPYRYMDQAEEFLGSLPNVDGSGSLSADHTRLVFKVRRQKAVVPDSSKERR